MYFVIIRIETLLSKQEFIPDWTGKQTVLDNMSSLQSLPISAPQVATSHFSLVNLLGEGTLVIIYRSNIHHGQILAVKSTVALSITDEEQFMEVTRITSPLKHSNIVALISYFVGHGNHLLVYEYIRTVTLDDVLHNVLCMPLTWSLRICIARALKQASADSGNYVPEHVKQGSDNPKADISSFGVLLVEILTERQPFGSSKPKGKQSLVVWASFKLHDSESLLDMADPIIRRTSSTGVSSSSEGTISQGAKTEKEEDKKEEEGEEIQEEEEEEEEDIEGEIKEEKEEEIQLEEKEKEEQQSLQIEVENNAGDAGREEGGEEEQQQALQIEVDNNAGDAGREEERPHWLRRNFSLIAIAAFGI
ncbi:protein STRUBBELIG-RECEPTOR FAMILY 2-like [Solanum dulcamara]|uniref:protein STRUBBELIG-RECEPTOR FAMILY 2-like n=1 Tax=Solanum dulcamara TaxID=45834 RepID=UPI0024858E04|nr:protein STRUBBELIG-RECEPTOR FAMILY 2-like [Solanum dulcamara]